MIRDRSVLVAAVLALMALSMATLSMQGARYWVRTNANEQCLPESIRDTSALAGMTLNCVFDSILSRC